ncbi:hypothetical protein NQ176_g9138 [Zarea fungicola]|uniref:Uncharacterized protein n=1 Tax=Zarea fungicola TaxID=93591 RepID=A0ACC1MQN4_9HYPO|nr:hypothetical protein NQ176_g9138 [Lecanicillium fungicola]
MPAAVEDLLLDTYRGRAQIQYPLFHWNTFLQWHLEWKNCPPSEFLSRSWQGFFVNLVYSTALLLLSPTRVRQSDARTFYNNGISLLRHVLRQHDDILRVQAYLLLSLQALHRSSTPRILSLVSTTMRLCVQLQFHLAETEMEPATPEIRFKNQIRRRCFWSAYSMDRLVMASFEMPPCLPDEMITTKLFANMDDDHLQRACAETPADAELLDSVSYTCVSPSLHILQCRRIQSEICTFILRWDYKEHYENSLEWRIRILNELERYKARVKNFTDPDSKGHSSQRWLAMIYHYTLLLLYRPTKDNVLGPAGDWAIQASSQACLIFRRSQMDRQVAQAWLGILVQFQSGVTLLYCCWSTPPEYRTDSYDSPDVSDALRACSNNLAIMADRWPKADCLRDVFELLAREVPLVDSQNRSPTRISKTSADSIKEKLPQVQALIMHRTIIRMIGEMINDDFPRLHGSQPLQPPPRVTSRRATPGIERQPSLQGEARSTFDASALPDILSFELPFSAQQIYNGEINVEASQLGAEELLAFPGMFDVEGWP